MDAGRHKAIRKGVRIANGENEPISPLISSNYRLPDVVMGENPSPS